MKGTGEKELPVHKKNYCLSNVDSQDPLQKMINSAPPDVYTGRTFSACRPIVGVGDQHDVVQSVSNAISEVTICHKVNSPHHNK